MHSHAIELIEAELARVEVSLSETNGDEDILRRKLSLESSLRLMRSMQDHEILRGAKAVSVPAPDDSGCLMEYRVMNDYETEDRSMWHELMFDGESIRLTPGDIIITNSE